MIEAETVRWDLIPREHTIEELQMLDVCSVMREMWFAGKRQEVLWAIPTLVEALITADIKYGMEAWTLENCRWGLTPGRNLRAEMYAGQICDWSDRSNLERLFWFAPGEVLVMRHTAATLAGLWFIAERCYDPRQRDVLASNEDILRFLL